MLYPRKGHTVNCQRLKVSGDMLSFGDAIITLIQKGLSMLSVAQTFISYVYSSV